jgi:Flp pilus assembly protein TadD
VEALSQATRLDPDFALAHAALGRALWMDYDQTRDPARLDAAVAAAQRAVTLDPDLPEARLTQALVLYAGEAGDVATDVAGALARHPHPASARGDLAVIHERRGRDDEAQRLLREAVAMEGDDWFHWNRLGVFLFRHGDLGGARTALERAAGLAPPAVARPRENLAVLAVQELRFDDAFSILESLPESMADAAFADTMATAFFFSGRPDKWEKAERYYRLAVERAPSRPEYRGNLADLYRKLDRSQEALALYREALGLAQARAGANPGDVDASLLAAFYAAKAEDCPAALDGAARLEPAIGSSADRAHRLAIVYSLCRDRAATLVALERAVEHGFPAAFIAQEDEFRWLAEDPELRDLVGARVSR